MSQHFSMKTALALLLSGALTATAVVLPRDAPKCNGINNIHWVPHAVAANAITKFCAEAEKQGVQDPGSGSLVRNYKSTFGTEMSIAIDWPSGNPFKPTMAECTKQMTAILDGCDGNNPKNPKNWKHGGNLKVGVATYQLNPQANRYLHTGKCSMHMIQYDDATGNFDHKHRYFVKITAKDTEGKVMYTMPQREWAEDGKPYKLNDVYGDTLVVTPETRGDYVQFGMGQNGFTTKDACTVGKWDWAAGLSDNGHRDMDCSFDC
ncbi:hypothetical protein B0J14DRAFT_668448 [Halenospora varia]|nr:hypothetical protein B0J14DRAFT_668448 [Halenospora varia]